MFCFFIYVVICSFIYYCALLRLHTQPYLWGSPFRVRFVTIQVVTFGLRGRCMLGVFLSSSSPVLDMNVRIFGVPATECMCAQTRHRFILSSERFLKNGVRTHVDSKAKILSSRRSQEGGASEAASRRTASPTHYLLSYSGPIYSCVDSTVSTYRKVVSDHQTATSAYHRQKPGVTQPERALDLSTKEGQRVDVPVCPGSGQSDNAK